MEETGHTGELSAEAQTAGQERNGLCQESQGVPGATVDATARSDLLPLGRSAIYIFSANKMNLAQKNSDLSKVKQVVAGSRGRGGESEQNVNNRSL